MRTRFLQVSLGERLIGYLCEIDRTVRFAALNAYIDDPWRPTLSMSFGLPGDEQNVRATLSNLYAPANVGQGVLPTFFSNLLPEGPLRARLARQRGTSENAEFDLLAAAGNNLPGAIFVRPAASIPEEIRVRLITTDNDNVEVTQIDEPIDGASSLSGVQDKLALSMLRDGEQFTTEGAVDGIPVIAKFAPRAHPDMLQNELVCSDLARMVGVDAVRPSIYPIERLDRQVLRGVTEPGPQFLASRRFDHSEQGRIHVEDWCQITSLPPGRKYSLQQHFPIASEALLRGAADGPAEIAQLFKRIVTNALMGNCDAHLKNFMCIYPDGRLPMLSPAYDLICALPYAIEADLKTNLALDTTQRHFRLRDYVEFAEQLGFSTKLAEFRVRETVTAAVQKWPTRLAQPDVPAAVRSTIAHRLETMALIRECRA